VHQGRHFPCSRSLRARQYLYYLPCGNYHVYCWSAGDYQLARRWHDSESHLFKAALVGIYTGNADQQTLLQTVSTSIDVSTTSSITFTPDGTIGPNSNEYFVRFTSLNLKDATNSQFPAEAFSAKFTLTGMTGTFNSTLQAEIDGQSTAPIGATATSSAPGTMMTISMTSATSTSGSKTSLQLQLLLPRLAPLARSALLASHASLAPLHLSWGQCFCDHLILICRLILGYLGCS
ncbi:hypothetical protein BDR07DRAFT_1510020, partial [Suillus spraguei]